MERKRGPELTPILRALLTTLQGDHAHQDSNNSQVGQIELSLLPSLREKPHFDDIASTSNDSSQTPAHLSILSSYISSLMHLVEWGVDLTVPDISHLIARHCAYLEDDRERIRAPLRVGSLFSINVKLGRLHRGLLPEGSYFADWLLGTEEVSPPIEHLMGHGIVLGAQFIANESGEKHDNASGHGGSDSGDIGFLTLEPSPSTSTVSILDLINQLLIFKKSREKRRPSTSSQAPAYTHVRGPCHMRAFATMQVDPGESYGTYIKLNNYTL
jgi:hypothetical protein